MQPGILVAEVAQAHELNEGLLRRWIRTAHSSSQVQASKGPSGAMPKAPFVQLGLPSAAQGDIRIELRRGAMMMSVSWPAQAGVQCAAWMRELLR